MSKKVDMEDLTGQREKEYINLIGNQQSPVSDEVSLKAISELLDMSKLKTITRLKFEQVEIITKLEMFAKVFDIDFTSQLAHEIMQLQISVNGYSRKELVQMVQQRDMLGADINPKKNKDIFR